MKKSIVIYVLIANFFAISSVFAQNTNEEDQEVLDRNQERYLVLDQSNVDSYQVSNENFKATNSVFIQQIGVNNSVVTKVESEFSDISLYQKGNQNKVDINETSKEIRKFVVQTGTNNTVVDFSFNPEISTNLEITQQGNNLYFEKFGSNELSKNLKFNMTGTNRSIIIRSF